MPVTTTRESEGKEMSCHSPQHETTSPNSNIPNQLKKSTTFDTTSSSDLCIKDCIIKDDEEDSPGCQRSPTDLSMSSHESCAGCGTVIQDRYVLLALDRRWHSQCLKCSECCTSLDSAVSCFTREGKIYCKSDYYKMFVKRCTRCGQSIFATDLVMRARENIYHLSCFTCAWCNVPMTRGDIFGIAGNLVYCRIHYELRRSVPCHTSLPPMSLPHFPGHHHEILQSESAIHPNHNQDGNLSPPNPYHDPILIQPPGHFPGGSSFPFHHHSIHSGEAGGILDTLSNVSNGPSKNTGRGTGGGRKGRPRKRKNPNASSVSQSNNNNNSSCPTDNSRTCDSRADGQNRTLTGEGSNNCNNNSEQNSHPSFTGSPSLIHSMDGSGNFDTSTNIPDHSLLDSNSNGGHSSIGSGRTKRMRTSFKHHQLRTMKQYFAINQNPDAKDLKQLAQKTSLSKRVLQVWFQNARAKWRRNNLKGGGNGQFQMDPNNSNSGGIHLPPISSLNHSNQSNESNSQPLPSMTTGHLLTTMGQSSGPGSVGQISSSISILNPETPNTSTGIPSPGGSSCGGGGRGHFSAPSPSPSLTGSTTGNFLSELTGIGRHGHGYGQEHSHNVHVSRQNREQGSSGSGSLDQFTNNGFKPERFKSSPGGQQHSPSPARTPPINGPAFPTHLSIAQIHSHFRSHHLIHPAHHPGMSTSPRIIHPNSPESRFQELY